MGMERDELHNLAEQFAKEYRELVTRYYGQIQPRDFEPFGMRLRELLPVTELGLDKRVTTTKTISIPWDTDPPDEDEPI